MRGDKLFWPVILFALVVVIVLPGCGEVEPESIELPVPVVTPAQALEIENNQGGEMPIHAEDAEQQAVFDWAAYQPALRWLHAIPNGGGRDKREAARLKRQGVKPGVADIFLPIARGGYHGLYIEMKRTPKQGRSSVSPDQAEFLNYATAEGYAAVICYGADEAIQTIKNYLAGLTI